jgi:hypothetical protein
VVENCADVRTAILWVHESFGHVEDITAGMKEFG